MARFYYPRIEVTGQVPAEGPVLLVANHPNSLLDPLLLGIAAQRPVRLLAKAPLFKLRGLGWIMRTMGMIPAHRGSDSMRREDIKKNLASLSTAAAALGENGGSVVGIFPEGKSHDDMQVALVRSGAARLAMQAVEAGVKGLRIVPIGLNYENKDRFRSAVWINIGDAIDGEAWFNEGGSDRREAMRALTPEIDQRMKQVAIHLDDTVWEPLVSEVEGLLPAGKGLKGPGVLQLRRRVAEAINQVHRDDPETTARVAAQVQAWAVERKASGLPADARFFRQPMWWRLVALATDMVKLSAVLLLAVPGLLHHLIPHGVTRFFAARMDQPGKMTVALNRLLVGVVVHPLWAIAIWIGMMQVFRPWFAWLWLVGVPFMGFAAVWLVRRLRIVAPIWWAELKLLGQRSRAGELRRQRDAVLGELLKLAEQFPFEQRPSRLSRLWRTPRWLWATIAMLVGLFAFNVGVWLLRDRPLEIWQTEAPALHLMSDRALVAKLAEDERALAGVIRGLTDLESTFRAFEQELISGDRSYYRPADDDEIRRMLTSFLSLRTALVRTLLYYERHDQVAAEELRLRALLLHYTSAALLYDYSARFVLAFEESGQAQAKLNEAEPRWDLPAGTYDRIRQHLAHVTHREWLVKGWNHYHETMPRWQEFGQGPSSEGPAGLFHQRIAEAGERTAELGARILNFKVATAWSDLRNFFDGSYYRASAAISTIVGDARLRAPRDGTALVTPELLDRLRPLLRPGDVLIERRNWYLSNAFLPGYWPHAALYVGSREELMELGLGDHSEVVDRLDRFSGSDDQGYPFRIIESVSEGVIFTSLEHSAGEADAVVVLRPQVSDDQRRAAIARAFSHEGKPYDFDFDFFSSDKLVCTEVIYRAYGDVIDFPLEEILGRQTLPAINIIESWAEDGPWKMIAFIDGDDSTGTAKWADESTLRESLSRPPLTILN